MKPFIKDDKFKNIRHLFTERVFLIGNGSSRNGFDLNTLVGKGTIIGCNALYRDFTPDILIAHDSKMLAEIHRNKYPGFILSDKGHGHIKNKLIFKLKNARTSGSYGLRFISEIMQPKECYVLGIDGYPGNVYIGTENYNDPTFKYYNSVTKQYKEIVEKSNTAFFNVNIKDTWNISTPNYKFMTYGELTQR